MPKQHTYIVHYMFIVIVYTGSILRGAIYSVRIHGVHKVLLVLYLLLMLFTSGLFSLCLLLFCLLLVLVADLLLVLGADLLLLRNLKENFSGFLLEKWSGAGWMVLGPYLGEQEQEQEQEQKREQEQEGVK